jgi:two-component system, sensor histidine kinase and response regulator
LSDNNETPRDSILKKPDNESARVLIIDDSIKNIQLVGKILIEEDINFAYALSGMQGVEMLYQMPFDLVLLDIMMPEMDGFEVCQVIRQNKNWDNLPIIFLSAHNEMEKIVAGLKGGGQDYVSKPFNRAELLARIRTHIQMKKQSDILKNNEIWLEHQIEMRTRDLRQAYQRLSILDESKRDFIGLISHELRTPLQPIQSISELLEYYIQDPEALSLMRMLKESAERLSEFITVALRIAEIQSKAYKPNIKKISLTAMIAGIIDLYPTGSIELQLPDNNSHEFDGDIELLQCAIQGIIQNKLQYAGENQPLKLMTKGSNYYIFLQFSDNGPGFPDKVLVNFGQFFNTDDLNHHSKIGYGLHLAVSKLIIDVHGGEMTIFNRAEGGAIVNIILPKVYQQAHTVKNE